MDKAKHNERPTDIVLTGTLREEASAQALGAIRRTSPIYKASLWMGPENLGDSHEREILSI